MITVFVYGTLREGCYNHYLLEGAVCTGKRIGMPGILYVAPGASYPQLKLDKGGTVWGELYEIDEAKKQQLDSLELPYGYLDVILPWGDDGEDVLFYVYDRPVDGFERIESGDFVQWLKESQRSNS